MNFRKLNTYNDSYERAFEALCNQLFERWLKRNYGNHLTNFFVVNGSGGDGGVEAYGELDHSSIIGVQAKSYLNRFENDELRSIKRSILTAKRVRPQLFEYIVCVPRNFTDKKIVTGGRTAKNTDIDKIKKLEDEIKQIHPDVKITFWGEHALRIELQYLENEGVRKFWFEKEIISVVQLKNQFDKALAGWLNTRYIPDLHSQGFIESQMGKYLYEKNYCEQIVSELKNNNAILYNIIEIIKKINTELTEGKIKDFIDYLERLTCEINFLIESVSAGKINLSFDLPAFEFYSFFEFFDKIKVSSDLKPELERFNRHFRNIDIENIIENIQRFVSSMRPSVLIFSGPPRSGKTHALAHAVQERLDHNLPSLIIEAKNAPAVTWTEILQYATNCNWNDEEILNALEAQVHIQEIARVTQLGDNGYAPVKALVAIDGIEEATEGDRWKDRINELTAFINRFPRVQFVITSRNYFLDQINIKKDKTIVVEYLPHAGDVSVHELFPDYAHYFNTPNAPWIGYALKDLLSLRIFCQLYTNKPLPSDRPVKTSFVELTREKIFLLENELNDKFNNQWDKKDQVVTKILLSIAKEFFTKGNIDRDELIKIIKNVAAGFVDGSEAGQIIGSLTNHDILNEEKIYDPVSLQPAKHFYKMSYQSLLEFIIANDFTEQIIQSETKTIPKTFVSKLNLLQIASDILISDYNVLVGENGLWEELSPEKILEIRCNSLLIAPVDIAGKNKFWVSEHFFKSYKTRNIIFEHLILPASRISNHVFGAVFLHELLSNCKNVYDRDLAWSGPDYGSGKEYERISYFLKNETLSEFDEHLGLPLIFTWSLTSVDNIYREFAKQQLTAWAFKKQNEFFELLKLLFGKYDLQLDEDISIILLGVASLQQIPTEDFKDIAIWITKNIFDRKAIKQIKNVVIRHCCRAFIERAYHLKLIDNKTAKSAVPPYKTPFELLPLDIGKSTGSEGQRFPIVHDLAWYVIKRSYEDFLKYNDPDEKDSITHNFQKKYKKEYNNDLGPYEFAVSAAIAFIKNLGWHSDETYGTTQASHGSLSNVSTHEEKYVWLAVHEIQGYLANYLPYRNSFTEEKEILNDYNKIVNVHNPANELKDNFFPEINNNWIIPTDISPILKPKSQSLREDIKNWVNQKWEPDFKKWFEINSGFTDNIVSSDIKEWLVLYNYTSLSEQNNIGQTSLHTTAFLIEERLFKEFLKSFKKAPTYFSHYLETDSLHAQPDADIYISPVDVIWMTWLKENNSYVDFNNEFSIIHTITEITDRKNDSEKFFVIPSKKVRKWLDIVNGNGNVFLNSRNEIKGFTNSMGKPYYEQQKVLLVDKKMLYKKIKEEELKIIWSVFLFQDTTMAIKSRHNEHLHYQNCRLYLCWLNKNKVENLLYLDGYFRNDKNFVIK